MNKEDWYKTEKLVFDKFKNSLNKIKTLHEAKSLIKEAPPKDTPGRTYYTRFSLFIDGFYLIPDVKSKEEILLYKDFVQKLFNNKELKPEDFKIIIYKINDYINKNFDY